MGCGPHIEDCLAMDFLISLVPSGRRDKAYHPCSLMPGFGVRLIIVVPTFADVNHGLHPVRLFAVFDMHVTKDEVRASVMARGHVIVSLVQGTCDVAVLKSDSREGAFRFREIANSYH